MGKKIDLEVDFFKVLGVKASSSDEEVKKAYKALAKQWHPDKNRDDGAEEKFKSISAAYETLRSADERSIYRREREQAETEVEREKKRKNREANFNFYQPSSSDGLNSRYKTSFFFKTGGDGRGQNYNSDGSDSWRYHGREESPFSGPYGYKTKDTRSEKKNKKNTKQRKQRPGGDEDSSKKSGPERKTFQRSNFSTAFNSFIDDLFHFDSFFSEDDPFDAYLKKYHNMFDPFAEKKPPPENKKEYTYYKTFGDSARKENKPQNTRFRTADSPPGFSFDDYPDDDDEEDNYECSCCGKKYTIQEEMIRHEVVCKDVNGRANASQRYTRPIFPKTTGDWRSTHENLVNNIRNARRSNSKTRADDDSEDMEGSPRPEEYVKCHICGRTFNKPAMKQHTVHCQMRYQANCGEPEDPNLFYSREQYPKSMPFPGSGIPPSGRPPSAPKGNESPRTSRTTTPSKYSSRTCYPDFSTRRTMDDPFVFTRTGLSSHRTSSQLPPQPTRVHEFRFSSKGGNDFGMSGSRMGFQDERKNFTRNQCPNCHSVYARNARYCISCGFKRAG